MKYWITKYALTKGILETENAVESSNDILRVKAVDKMDSSYDLYIREGREWHRTLDEAISRSDQMRDKAIANHRKAIAKLENMNFSVIKHSDHSDTSSE